MRLTYFGEKKEIGPCKVEIEIDYEDGIVVYAQLKHIVKHSPDGFQWGYMGSGPADLALSILTDFCERFKFGHKKYPDIFHQKFKEDFLWKKKLNITSDEITIWFKNIVKIEPSLPKGRGFSFLRDY